MSGSTGRANSKKRLADNNVSEKQYYYWLRRVRAATIKENPIPALPEPEKQLPTVSFAEIPVKEVLSTEESPVIVIKTKKSTIEIPTAVSDALVVKIVKAVAHAL